MSFFKNLFDKRKDSKYGKGHKLGDKASHEAELQNQQAKLAQTAVHRPQTSQTDAARAAGQAALSRLQNSKIKFQNFFK